MELSNHFISIKKSLILFFTTKPPFSTKALTKPFDSHSPKFTPPARSLQLETLKTLEWSSLCNQLTPFTSTLMGKSITRNAKNPIGKSKEESQKLLDQIAATLAMMESFVNQVCSVINVSPILLRYSSLFWSFKRPKRRRLTSINIYIYKRDRVARVDRVSPSQLPNGFLPPPGPVPGPGRPAGPVRVLKL